MNRREWLKAAGALAASAASGKIFSTPALSSQPSVDLQAKLARDPQRPQFHLLPAANWMNDPNGPIYWNGRYHMFFQYNPNGAYWGDMHWAHAMSHDMVHWKHLPIALSPTPWGPDSAGCFSGSTIVDNGGVTALYTGVVRVPAAQTTVHDGVHFFRESQCLAISRDPELIAWTKLAHPVIAAPPRNLHPLAGFRDPCPWRMGNWWYLALGSGLRHREGVVLLYRSKDLRRWDYIHFLASGRGSGANTVNPADSGDMWECPDFFPLAGKHVLIYSSQGAVHWQSGVLDEEEMKFHPRRFGVLDHGAYYAAKTQLDAQGNRIVWGWIPERRPLAEYKSAGWAGMMSLPRMLRMDDDGRLGVEVSPAVAELRSHERKLTNGGDTASQLEHFIIEQATGELLGTFGRGNEHFRITLVGSLPQGPMSEPVVTLEYNPNTPNEILTDGTSIPIDTSKDQPLKVHIYVDGSVVEVFLQQAAAYTKRFYYPGPVAPRVQLKFQGPPRAIESLSMWQIEPISSDRLTS